MCNKNAGGEEKKLKRKEAKIRNKQLKKALKHQRKMEKIEIRNNRLPDVILWVVFLSIIFVVFTTMVSIGVLLHVDSTNSSDENIVNSSFNNTENIVAENMTSIPVNAFEEKAEATLLASGLSIIGIAISVWAGLNIIQVLSRDKFLLLNSEVEKHSKERFETNRQNFIARIRAFDNIINHYLANKIHMLDYSEEIHDLYFSLVEIENIFQSIFMQQYLVERNIPAEEYDDAIRKCEQLLKKVGQNEYTNKDFFIEYLYLHIAEFYFYKGYLVESEGESIEKLIEYILCYEKAIYYFEELYEVLKTPTLLESRDYIDNNVCYTAFMLNTIGEAYSKILEYTYKAKEKGIKRKAEFREEYFERLERLIEENKVVNTKGLKREVYYRNYGKAIERRLQYTGQSFTLKDKPSEKIRALYKTAVDIALGDNREQIRYKTFRAYLDFYYRTIENIDLLKLLNSGKRFENEEGVIEYSKQAMFYTELAKNIFPRKIIFLKYVVYIECKLCICMFMKNKNKDAIFYLRKIKEHMRNIEKVDDYSNETIFDFEKLKNEINAIIRYSKGNSCL